MFRFLKLFTEVPLQQIKEYEKLEGAALNDVKIILADEATKMLHGAECLPGIHATIKSLFSGAKGEDLDCLPVVSLMNEDLIAEQTAEIAVVDVLIKAQFVDSKAEGRRMIKGGGIRINDEKLTDDYAKLTKSSFDNYGRLKLSSGKKKHVVVTWPNSML
jgi:tyrosyl-tRNA synthetase